MVKEWMIGKNRAWYDEATGCLMQEVHEEQAPSDIKELTRAMTEAFVGKTSKRFMIIDVGGAKSQSLSSETRKAMQDEMPAQADLIDKAAVVGASPAVRMVAKVITRIQKNRNVRFFATVDEALAWFKEG